MGVTILKDNLKRKSPHGSLEGGCRAHLREGEAGEYQ